MAVIRIEQTGGGIMIYVPHDKLKALRDNLISTPGLTTKPSNERTALEDVAIKLTAVADRLENEEII